MQLEFFTAVDTGRARSNNEDAVALDEPCGLAVLADGMGGYNAGEVASDLTIRTVCSELGRWLKAQRQADPAALGQAMAEAASAANRAVLQAAASNPAYEGMGTTLVMAVFHGDRLFVGHIGDSRAYRWRQGSLQRLTRDHSLLQEQLDAGLITEAEAAVSMNRNLVTRALGVEPDVQLEVHDHDLQDDDLLLMCSDGLSDMLDDERIAEQLRAYQRLGEVGGALVVAANEAGGRDNISLVLVRVRAKEHTPTRSWWPFRRS